MESTLALPIPICSGISIDDIKPRTGYFSAYIISFFANTKHLAPNAFIFCCGPFNFKLIYLFFADALFLYTITGDQILFTTMSMFPSLSRSAYTAPLLKVLGLLGIA